MRSVLPSLVGLGLALNLGLPAHPAGASPTRGDVLSLPAPPSEAPSLPVRGQTMRQVEAQLGAPLRRHAPVGGGHPRQPPITRWDYPEMAVFFEHDRVIDAVLKDAPKPLRNVEALRSSTP